MADYNIQTDSAGNCQVDKKIPEGDLVSILIDVVNPPHFDWGPVKSIHLSDPPVAWIEVEGLDARSGLHEPRFDFESLSLSVINGDVLVEFVMPDCLFMQLDFSVDFWPTSVYRQAADQDSAVISYTNKTSPKPVKLKVPSFSTLPNPN